MINGRDPSLIGWFLPPTGYLHPFGELLIVIIGYALLIWLIVRLLRRYLGSDKAWHKKARRAVWLTLAALMLIDPVYYYFGIVHGHCADDRARVYPAPPASYVVAGPMSHEEISKLDLAPYETGEELIYYWRCEKSGVNGDNNYCAVRHLSRSGGELNKKTPFGFARDAIGAYSDVNTQKLYSESYEYRGDGHWLTNLLFGVKINFIDYERWSSCSQMSDSKDSIINLD